MIEAIEITKNHFVVRSINPANGEVYQKATAYSEGDAIRLAHTFNRLYIIEKMTGWLHQRIVALQIGGSDTQVEQAVKLLDRIEICANTSVSHLRKVISANENTIRFIAPGERSRQYAYYQKVILDILFFCQEMKEVTV